MTPVLGRTWPDAYDRSRHFSVVISDGLWQRRFGRDPQVLTKTMTLDGADGYEIVGVAPPNLTFPSRSDLFRSIGISTDPTSYERRDRVPTILWHQRAHGCSVVLRRWRWCWRPRDYTRSCLMR